ncbi:uncharacterized protein AB675_8281 [Cyphellophora attinorum]|uniref:Conserved oligomeric Golgi complex subunit 8 n=1 Tax=Cyphellophora attinorum TaxID=1664694 RepID=A0A0N1P2Z7_9EURO|nr:uncharacterized protein AB675_8281 [Phialophora attinorum]KPI44302.1 hypothetical protein AB675_8281 [Phialophora attinorum]
MAESLFDLLKGYLPASGDQQRQEPTRDQDRYLSRILSLRLSDLSTSETESLQQASHSNNVSIQSLSSRSYRTTTSSFEHLRTLGTSLQDLSSTTTDIRNAVPELDESAVKFATSYSKLSDTNAALDARKKSMLLARQAEKVQEILELPMLLSAAIASANNTSSTGVNYSQALDLFSHIKRLQILYPDSEMVKKVLVDAKVAMRDMTTNLITSLRNQNIRLAAAIRTIGWLRRVLPEISKQDVHSSQATTVPSSLNPNAAVLQQEDDFGAIFLCARLCTFLTMAEALAPLRELADQETAKRNQTGQNGRPAEPVRRSSQHSYAVQGQQTERYIKRYIEIFREQAFSTISMFRNIFPPHENQDVADDDPLRLPSALATFPSHLVGLLMETLRTYLPNITDPASRESLLMQVLYAANSLGRLGADFSMMIATLPPGPSPDIAEDEKAEPEWARIIRKHRVQSARLEALAAGQEQAANKSKFADIAVR